MSGPKDATTNASGFRLYHWEGGDTEVNRRFNAVEPRDVLSVTSIRKLCGESFTLVAWQLANIIDVALGTQKRTVIGPRGGVSEKRQVWEFPSEFAVQYAATEGQQAKIDALRKWMRSTGDEPRNIAARRGSIVHKAIEKSIAASRISRDYVEAAFEDLSKRDRDRAKSGVSDEDIRFIHNAMRQYEDMREKVPFVILAREPQVFNLTAGYAGSADVLMWFLPEGTSPEQAQYWQKQANQGKVTVEDIEQRGRVVLGDWKTSADVHTDHVVQVTAYLAAEFIAHDGIIDERLTAILGKMQEGALIHIRPNTWAVDFTPFSDDVILAFMGSCALARFLFTWQDPAGLFTSTINGVAPDADEEFTDVEPA